MTGGGLLTGALSAAQPSGTKGNHPKLLSRSGLTVR